MEIWALVDANGNMLQTYSCRAKCKLDHWDEYDPGGAPHRAMRFVPDASNVEYWTARAKKLIGQEVTFNVNGNKDGIGKIRGSHGPTVYGRSTAKWDIYDFSTHASLVRVVEEA